MKKRLRKTGNNLNTDLYALLKSLPDHILNHQEHSIRHPLAIYNVSVQRVVSSFDSVISSINNENDYSEVQDLVNGEINYLQAKLESITETEEKTDTENRIMALQDELRRISKEEEAYSKQILNSVKELLDSLMSFIDDTYHILKCFYPANSVTKNIVFADKWMEKAAKKLTNDYKDKINEYRESLAPIVNKIKHNHARLRRIIFDTVHGRIEGYYVEGVDSKGSLGTDITIHKKFRNQETAFSLNRDLKYHFVNFNFVCHHLKVIIERILKDQNNLVIDTTSVIFDNSDDYLDIAKKIALLPNLYFPDEVFKPHPDIVIGDDYAELVFPASSVSFLLYEDCHIRFTSVADGVSNALRLPYWIPRKQN